MCSIGKNKGSCLGELKCDTYAKLTLDTIKNVLEKCKPTDKEKFMKEALASLGLNAKIPHK